MPWLQLRFDYDTTTIRLRRTARACFHDASKNERTCQFFVVVVSQSNRTHIVISITFVVVESVVVSSYRSRIVFESQLWYRLNGSSWTNLEVVSAGQHIPYISEEWARSHPASTAVKSHWQSIIYLLRDCQITRLNGSFKQLQQIQDEEVISWISRWKKAREK